MTALLKGMLRGKRKQATAMESYLNCIPTIQRLIDTHKLGINLKERMVVMDISLHACLAEHYPGGSDRKHIAFFDKLVAYMNFQLGRMGKTDFIDPKKDTIRFQVTTERMMYVDEQGHPLPAHKQVQFGTVLIGWYRGGELEYKSFEE